MDYMHVVYTYTKKLRGGKVKTVTLVGCRVRLLYFRWIAVLIDLGYCKIESCLAFSMTGSSLES